jgi:hypothetical protein
MANSSKARVPKRVGGVKIPKPLRRTLKDLSRTRDGRKLIANSLLAVGVALGANSRRPAAKARRPGAKTARRPKAPASDAAAAHPIGAAPDLLAGA